MKNSFIILILVVIITIGAVLATITIIKINNDDTVDLGIEKGGTVEYSREILNHFDLKIIGTSEIKKKANVDEEKFYIDMKEYLYKNGLVKATEAKYKDYESNNQFTIISYELNDENRTTVFVKINNKDKTYTFFDNYRL
ncbi:MAG: hypothetical protein IKG14_00865 [Clostridia bacterium]|nr:hypothetical protein [Clostridia bacterium]MBR3324587.1 hypothetical protein [Clostridia bacterium]